VLNVGGGSKSISIPACYDGWDHVLLDINPKGIPDICADARELERLANKQFDAVYCSHNLEHYYSHFTQKVLRGFRHVLKDDGFADIRVPDLGGVMAHVVATGIDIEDVLYCSPAGPITVHDVLYGYRVEMERSGDEFYAHKTGFTEKSLLAALDQSGFRRTFIAKHHFQIDALSFVDEPNEFHREIFGL
jgi:SAM-dependent methyltransferase